MASPQDCKTRTNKLNVKTVVIATGLTFLLAIVGFSISLATDSLGLFVSGVTAVSVGVFALLLVLFGIRIRRIGLATIDTKTVGLFVLTAVALLTVLPETATFGLASGVVVVVLFGVVLPQLLIQYSRLGTLE